MNNPIVYLIIAGVMCLLSPLIIMAGWFAEQNEKINHENKS